jgi:serine/threonine protein kinase
MGSVEESAESLLERHPHPHIDLHLKPDEIHSQSLHTHVHEHGSMSLKAALLAMVQLSTAVRHTHRLGVALRDLKASRVILGGVNKARAAIASVAGASRVPEGQLVSDRVGSPLYAPPEFYVRKAYNAVKADIWILAVIFFIMLAGAYPFTDNNPADLLSKIRTTSPAYPASFPRLPKHLIEKMLSKNPEDRPSIDEVIETCLRYLQVVGGNRSHYPCTLAAVAPAGREGAGWLGLGSQTSQSVMAGCKHACEDSEEGLACRRRF